MNHPPTPRARGVIALAAALAAAVVCPLAPAQDEFVNFETGGVRPITVARVAGHDYLLVCNTPDDSVEIYDTHDLRFVARVAVGQRPVTVAWHPAIPRFYTCDSLGDSISAVRLQPDGNGGIDTFLEWTQPVGDEPTDIGFTPDGMFMLVTNSGENSVALLDSVFVQPLLGFGNGIDLAYPLFGAPSGRVLDEPRRVFFAGATLLVLGHKGGNTAAFDFDVLSANLVTGLQSAIGGLGSINSNMLEGPDGRVYAVGTRARNEVLGEPALRVLPTGFVESHLWVIDDVGLPTVGALGRDLNRDANGVPVARARALAAPADIALLQVGRSVAKVFVAAFGSDRVGVLHVDANAPSTWPATHVDLPNTRGGGYARSGPRGLALKDAAPAAGDPGARLYAFNQLNHSVAVVDPFTEAVVGTILLQHDPTPGEVRSGRELLYSADLSGNGFTSCSSCHVDARTDNLVWVLGEITGGPGDPLPADLLDGIAGAAPPSAFPAVKGPLMTQDLQGLVTHPGGGDATWLLGDAPYHWRGDRSGIPAFNGAFVALMGAPNLGTPQNPRGLDDAQMARFVAMLDTVMVPPNPRQPNDRVYSGAFGSPDLDDGTGALRGLKLFHTLALTQPNNAGRSCVHCHALPDGSNQRITEMPQFQPLLSASLRGLVQREARLEHDDTPALSSPVTAASGLSSTGEFQHSINSFIRSGFFPPSTPEATAKLRDLIAFVRELDSGVAPAIGTPLSIRAFNAASPEVLATLGMLERQVARGDAGLAVGLVDGSTRDGFWFDVAETPPVYRSVVDGSTRSRAQVLALAQNDALLTAEATPAGSERRAASLDGRTTPLTGPAPSGIVLEPMVAGVHWSDVPSLVRNWARGTGPDDFQWTGEQSPGVPAAEPVTLLAMRVFQAALLRDAPQYGVTRLSHDAPRRFEVSGRDIRHGAKLELRIPAEPGVRPPYTGNERTQLLTVTLFATDQRASNGDPIWRSTAEVDPLRTYTLLLGGPIAPGVADALAGRVAEPPAPGTFDPLWNLCEVGVVNADGTRGSGGWQTVRVR